MHRHHPILFIQEPSQTWFIKSGTVTCTSAQLTKTVVHSGTFPAFASITSIHACTDMSCVAQAIKVQGSTTIQRYFITPQKKSFVEWTHSSTTRTLCMETPRSTLTTSGYSQKHCGNPRRTLGSRSVFRDFAEQAFPIEMTKPSLIAPNHILHPRFVQVFFISSLLVDLIRLHWVVQFTHDAVQTICQSRAAIHHLWLDVLVPFVSCFDLSSYLLKSPAGECVDFDVVWWEEGEVVGGKGKLAG